MKQTDAAQVIDWSIRDGSRLVDCGRARGTEREVLERVLRGELGSSKLEPYRSYSVRAGGSTASAYGDEMAKVAGASNLQDTAVAGGYLFGEPAKPATKPASLPPDAAVYYGSEIAWAASYAGHLPADPHGDGSVLREVNGHAWFTPGSGDMRERKVLCYDCGRHISRAPTTCVYCSWP